MNLPNLLTILRIFFVPLLVAVLVADKRTFEWAGYTLTNETVALAVFLAAAATDLLDGYLARRLRQVTTVGTLLDPIADKLLVSAALISLVAMHRVAAWLAILIVGREFAISGLRSIAAAEGYTIKASDLGKTKMLMQVLAISVVILGIRWESLQLAGDVAMWLVAFFAVVSAWGYFRKFWKTVDVQVKRRRRRELLRLDRERRLTLLAERKARIRKGAETRTR